MTSRCGLGYYPQNGQIITGRLDQTSRIERSGTYDAAAGTVLGTRVVCHRLYAPRGTNDQFDSVRNGNAWTSGTAEYLSMNSGHVVLWSCSGDGTTSATIAKNSGPFYLQISGGKWDQELQNAFARIEALNWGGAVVPIPTTTGSREVVPGSQYGGTKPTEMIWLQNHEPNINTGATRGTPAQFAGMMKHLAQLYDTWCASHSITTKHIKFAACLSNPSGTTNVNTVAGNFYDVGNSNDISKTGARPMDYGAWDVYSPRTENSGQGPVTASDEIAFAATSKYGACHAWTTAHMPAGCLDIIPEYAIRIPTSPVSGGAGPDPTWVATWYTGMITYLNANLVSGSHPVKYMCQYAAESVLSNKVPGGADNSIIPDQVTYKASFQLGVDLSTNPPTGTGVSLRPSFTAFHDALITLGNPSLTTGSPGVTPTGVAATTPAAGQTSATLSWTPNAANVSNDIYKDGDRTQTGVTGSSVTVFASSGSLPQIHTYAVGGVGTDGVHDAHTSGTVSVTYTPTTLPPPATPTGLAVPQTSIGQTTATATCNASTGATGYTWVVDGGTPVTTASPSLPMSGLTPGVSHTVTVAAFNSGGASAASSPVSFTTSSGPDTTPPSAPGGVGASIADDGTVVLSWTAATDPVVAGQTTSGIGVYVVARSLSPIPGTGTVISPATLTATGFIDTNPPSSPDGIVKAYYSVGALDNQQNGPTYASPLEVDLPAVTGGAKPTAVLVLPAGGLSFGQLFSVDGSQSTPGDGGNIVSWEFDFGDGITTGPLTTTSSARHAYTQDTILSPEQFTVTLTVTDASGLQGTTTGILIAAPDSGLFTGYTGTQKYAKNGPMTADVFNSGVGARESALAALDSRLQITEAALAQIGDPLTPRRHNGALFASVNPEGAGTFIHLAAATLYVVRCMTINGEPFSTVKWQQTGASVSPVTNAFFAVYDVAGNLMSPAGALTDVSADWAAQGEQTFTLDGGPFDPPLGADSGQDISATQEFFLAFYIATVGATTPQITCGSTWPIVNMGTSASAIAPSQANIQNVPIFSTSSATVSTPLNAPASLGNLTPWPASACVVLYP